MSSNNDAYRPPLAANKCLGQLSKVKSVSKDTKRIQTEVPLIVGTYGMAGWSSPIYIEKILYKKVPKKGLKGLLSPTQKLEEEREAPSCI